MKVHGRFVPFAALLLVALVASCGDKGTNPGGGGGGTLELNSGDLPAGRVFVHTFATGGTFNYHCERHPSMQAQVMVTGANDSAFVTINDFNFSPASVSVKAGGTIRWLNNPTAAVHTVTSN